MRRFGVGRLGLFVGSFVLGLLAAGFMWRLGVVGGLNAPAGASEVAMERLVVADDESNDPSVEEVPSTTIPIPTTTTTAPPPTSTSTAPVAAVEAQTRSGHPPVPAGRSVVATALRTEGDVPVWARPTDPNPTWQLSARTEFGGLRHFLVLEEREDWVRVSLPMRPNGTEGWLPREDVGLSESDYKVRIFLSDRSFEVWAGGEMILDTTPAVGNPKAPTPLGNWYIRDIFEWNENSPYGAYVLALSAYSESIGQINGGDAVVAIHGTNRPDLLGQAVSLGCVRLSNRDVTTLAQTVPVGTPVEVLP